MSRALDRASVTPCRLLFAYIDVVDETGDIGQVYLLVPVTLYITVGFTTELGLGDIDSIYEPRDVC